jgi:thiol-disulfide isomerase/thioredoxin
MFEFCRKILVFALLLSAFNFVSAQSDANEGLKKGAAMVDFGMRQVDQDKKKLGGLVWLSDFVGKKESSAKKKLLILSFYANWCKPCIAEMPFLQKMFSLYEEEGLMVLGINFRSEGEDFKETFDKSLKILKENKVKYPVLFDRFTNRNQLIYMGSKAVLPCLVIIDSKGKIIEKIQGGDSHDFKKIEEMILKHLDL